MGELLRRLDPCAAWYRLPPRTRRRLAWLLPAAALGAYLGVVSRQSPLSHLLGRLRRRRAHAGELAEARRLGLSFETVAADPAAHAGQPVAWCVASVDGKNGQVDERPDRPVVWTEPSDSLKTNTGVSGYCLKMLAVVTGGARGSVSLRPVERL